MGIDAGSLKALRAARVLRPLKLVSGIPSKCLQESQYTTASCESKVPYVAAANKIWLEVWPVSNAMLLPHGTKLD